MALEQAPRGLPRSRSDLEDPRRAVTGGDRQLVLELPVELDVRIDHREVAIRVEMPLASQRLAKGVPPRRRRCGRSSSCHSVS